ncbi:MAG: phosphate-starvation-inducible PsiE family protein, partial [Acidobacteriota bacterium]|nr:phosphate-starvation-inducible PsiE family protein [Acidobacteriota bacterium]
MNIDTLRARSEDYLTLIEVAIYSILGFLLSATAVLALAAAVSLLWAGLKNWSVSTGTFQILDQLLLVLMVVEILHTVRTSIKSHTLVTEPFLVVGLIA